MISVMLVDDQTLVLQGISTLLGMSERIQVVECVDSGEACLARLREGVRPDVLILDIHMPGMKGLDVLRAATDIAEIPIIFLTTFDDGYLQQQAARFGACGLLPKSIALDELVDAIERVAAGGTLFSARKDSVSAAMTPREMLIAESLVASWTNKEIASAQNLSPGTVKNYTSNLFAKLDVRNRAEAVVRLKELGLF